MKYLAIGILLLLGMLPLIIYPFVLLANVMSLAGQWYTSSSFLLTIIALVFYIGTIAYPLVYLICAGFAIAKARKNSRTALRFAAGPLGYLALLLGLGLLWSFSEAGISKVQAMEVMSGAVQISSCSALETIDFGDGLDTTGCGSLAAGETASGTTTSTTEAHNWQLKVTSDPLYANRFAITLKNDGKSCPDIKIYDSSGAIVQDFEDQKVPALCPEGLNSTAFHNFNPPKDDTYIIRVFTPQTPGAYLLMIEQK